MEGIAGRMLDTEIMQLSHVSTKGRQGKLIKVSHKAINQTCHFDLTQNLNIQKKI